MARRGRKTSGKVTKRLNLALQGGGAHGAFTWGVLDRLLEEEQLELEGLSGTSAGAINGALLAYGLCRGGRDGARETLDSFWRRIGEIGWVSPLKGNPVDWMARAWGLEPTPSYVAFDTATRLFSPYQFNPFNWNPLRDLLASSIDFEHMACSCPIKLFVSATNVRSGKIRIFESSELSVDVLLASACLPFLFQAVEIDGEAFWDGGYMGNPAIYPLFYKCAAPDVAVLQVNPIHRDSLPRTAPEILDRVNEISFNSTLMREMRAIAFVTRLIEEGRLEKKGYKRVNVHLIAAEAEMCDLGLETKLNPNPHLLERLKGIGRSAADAWLADHFEDIGVRSSIDIAERFL